MSGFLFTGITVLLFSCGRGTDQTNFSEPFSVHDSIYMNNANRLVALTFDTLRNSLMQAIGSRGFDGAIDFCHVQANALTETFADTVSIRRTALQYRNPQNKPDSLESVILNEMAKQQPPEIRLVRKQNGEVHFFKPILLQAMCLNCHGAPEKDIQLPTMNAINQKYPADIAVNFKEGDLRGAWHVTFESDRRQH